MITQYYDPGQEFQLCSSTELSTASNDWKWTGRTLSGLRDADGVFYDNVNDVPKTTMTGLENYISGIWTLNKSRHPIKIMFLGTTGEVSVRVSECNKYKPLATYSQPYVAEITTFTNLVGQTSQESAYAYWQGERHGEMQYNSHISIDITSGPTTSIKSIKWGTYHEAGQHMDISEWDYSASWGALWNEYISVDFIEKGILYYNPNKEYVNPR